MDAPSAEGKIAFHVPRSGSYETWYCVFGNLNSGKVPLVIVHGGPGACHEYLLPLKDLADLYSIPVVFYDQIGAGKSTHLNDKAGDESFWTIPLFISELNNLIDHLQLHKGRGYDFYGHSWGAMFGAEFLATRPHGLRKAVLASGPASMEVWLKGVHDLVKALPQDVQDVLDKGERENNFESPEYEAATEVFYKRHLCRMEPWPAPEVEVALGHMMGEGATVYGTMYGVSELVVRGNLKTWSAIEKPDRIEVPTLLINGRYDEAQDVSMMPFWDRIKKVRWVTLEKGSHFAHVEERQRYIEIIAGFLA